MDEKINNEKRLATMEQKLDDLKEDVKAIASDIKDHIRWEGEKYEKLDSKYSGKWVEKAIISIGTALIISILAAILKFV